MATSSLPWLESSLPYIGMVTAMAALATNMIISKMAMSKGTNFYLLCVYSNGLATLILFPTAFLFHRSKMPPLSFSVVWRVFLLASFGCFAEIGSSAGINYSSPTLGTAMINLVPGFTFILAVIFRMEKANWRRLSTISKSVGTIVSISGAFIVTFYKGPALLNMPLTSRTFPLLYLPPLTQDWVMGGLLLAFASFLTAAWCILQASILKLYPAEMIIVAFYCLFVTIQASLVSLVVGSVTDWRIETNIGLIAVLFAAIFNIAYRLYVTAWCISRTGPLFVALFKPLTIVIAVVIGVIFMKEALYVGSLVGAFVLITGFYAVIWGKSKEGGELNKGIESSSHEAPLLQDV